METSGGQSSYSVTVTERQAPVEKEITRQKGEFFWAKRSKKESVSVFFSVFSLLLFLRMSSFPFCCAVLRWPR